MSDTPRTDAETDKHVWPNSADNFARKLERELNALHRKVAAAEGMAEAFSNLLGVSENADETGYIADAGFVDMDKMHELSHAALTAWQEANK